MALLRSNLARNQSGTPKQFQLAEVMIFMLQGRVSAVSPIDSAPQVAVGKSVYPAAPVGLYQVDMSAISASATPSSNRATKSGLLI